MFHDKKKLTKVSLLVLTTLVLASCSSPNPNDQPEIRIDEQEETPELGNTTMIAFQKNI